MFVVVVAVAVVVVVPGGGGGGSTVPVMLVNVLYARDYEGKVGGYVGGWGGNTQHPKVTKEGRVGRERVKNEGGQSQIVTETFCHGDK